MIRSEVAEWVSEGALVAFCLGFVAWYVWAKLVALALLGS